MSKRRTVREEAPAETLEKEISEPSEETVTETKPEQTRFVVMVVKESGPSVRVRTGPGPDYPATGRFLGRTPRNIVEVSTGKDSTFGWGLLEDQSGWVNLDFATIVKQYNG